MRLLFIILTFFSLSADGQILSASPPYRITTTSSCSYILDDYQNAAFSYSLRKLRTAYSGSAIRVRRSSDNTEQDIGFVSCGDLDTASLKTFVGTGGTDDGFIVTWYDQSGNGRDLGQATAGNQPRIMDNGVVARNDGGVAIEGIANSYMTSSASAFMSLATHSDFLVFKETTQVNNSGILIWRAAAGEDYNRNDAFEIEMGAAANNVAMYGGAGSAYIISNNGTKSLYQLISHIISSGSGEAWQNGTSIGTDSYGSFTTMGSSLLLGARQLGGPVNTSYSFKGYFQEIIVYASDQSANRTGIQTNINTYWQVY